MHKTSSDLIFMFSNDAEVAIPVLVEIWQRQGEGDRQPRTLGHSYKSRPKAIKLARNCVVYYRVIGFNWTQQNWSGGGILVFLNYFQIYDEKITTITCEHSKFIIYFSRPKNSLNIYFLMEHHFIAQSNKAVYW